MTQFATIEPSAPEEVRENARARIAALSEFFGGFLPKGATLTLELGCGHGHFLTAYAAAHPERLCAGVDLISYRIERANRKKRRAGLENVAFLKAEALECLAALPDHCALERIFILFADPWPKRRHHARRLFRAEVLDALASRAAPQARLHFRTDDAVFFADSCAELEKSKTWERIDEPWPFEATSRFQEIHPVYQSLSAKLKG